MTGKEMLEVHTLVGYLLLGRVVLPSEGGIDYQTLRGYEVRGLH